MNQEEPPHISSTLLWKDVVLPSSVTEGDLDSLIVSELKPNWRKAAMVIVKVRDQCIARSLPISFDIIGARIQVLADAGALQSQGNLAMWRHSEVRLNQR
jgi:hypothetical protein